MGSAAGCGMSSTPATLTILGNSTPASLLSVTAELSTSSALTLTTCKLDAALAAALGAALGAVLGGRRSRLGRARLSQRRSSANIRTGKERGAVLSGAEGAWLVFGKAASPTAVS